MSENKEKPKDLEDLGLADKNFKDLDELLEWMASLHWSGTQTILQ